MVGTITIEYLVFAEDSPGGKRINDAFPPECVFGSLLAPRESFSSLVAGRRAAGEPDNLGRLGRSVPPSGGT